MSETVYFKGKLEKACTIAENYKEIFNNNRFYLELQENGIEEQKIANRFYLPGCQGSHHSLPGGA